MGRTDFLILILYHVALIAVCINVFKNKPIGADFYFGSRSIPHWTVSLSLLATTTSTITFVIFTAEFVRSGGTFFVHLIGLPIGFFMVTRLAIPAYYNLASKPMTIYELFRIRFGRPTEYLLSIIFFFSRIVWVALILYTASITIVTITNQSIFIVMIFTGLLAVGYTALGGIKADIYTDVLQSVMMFICLIAALIFVFIEISMTHSWHAYAKHFQQFAPLFPSNLNQVSTLSIIIWISVITFSSFAADQVSAQIYFCANSENGARRSLIGSMWVTIALNSMIGFLGIAIFVYFTSIVGWSENDVRNKAGDMLIHLMSNQMPSGSLGLLVAALLAAAMSSLDSALQAFNTVFRVNLRGENSAKIEQMTIGWRYRVINMGLGAVAVVLGSIIATIDGSLLEKAASLGAIFDGPMAGLFLIAFIIPRVRITDMVAGTISGILAWGAMKGLPGVWGYPPISPFLFLPFSVIVTFFTAWISSLFRFNRSR